MVEGAFLAAQSLRAVAPDGTPILKGLDLQVPSGQVTALFGPSGAGKSTVLLALAGLPRPGFRFTGSVFLEGRDLSRLPPAGRRRLLGREIGLVLQEPSRSLHPALTVGAQVAEGLRYHRGLSRQAAATASLEALEREGLTPPDRVARLYPHQLSGGMGQRVLLASVLALRPRVLLLDEPFAALDAILVTDLLRRLGEEVASAGVALLAAFHDLDLARTFAHRACFLAGGRVIEEGESAQLFDQPRELETARFLGGDHG